VPALVPQPENDRFPFTISPRHLIYLVDPAEPSIGIAQLALPVWLFSKGVFPLPVSKLKLFGMP
jgi:hypothetical protein